MRIISGKYKIRTLPDPKGFKARPTTDFARENLFNILKINYAMEGSTALDLFAGTGGISYELASNGCSKVTSVDKNGRHIAYIKSIIERVNIKEIETVRADAFKYIDRCIQKYDFIFADPPYDMPGAETIPDLIFEKQLLEQDGLLIFEHSKNHTFSKHPRFKSLKTYGSVHFSFFG